MGSFKVKLFAKCKSGFKKKISLFIISDDLELNFLKILISNAGILDRYWQ